METDLRVVALIRSFSNELIATFVAGLLNVGVDAVVVLINSTKDTADTATRLSRAFPVDRRVSSIGLDDYGWSRSLNAGIRYVERAHPGSAFLACSTDIQLTSEMLRELKDATISSQWCGFSRFRNQRGRSFQVPRNTCCMWHPGAFRQAGLFDETLDSFQGMEDYELCLRGFEQFRLLPQAIRLQPDLGHRFGAVQVDKTRREVEQMRLIDERFPTPVLVEFWEHLQHEWSRLLTNP